MQLLNPRVLRVTKLYNFEHPYVPVALEAEPAEVRKYYSLLHLTQYYCILCHS